MVVSGLSEPVSLLLAATTEAGLVEVTTTDVGTDRLVSVRCSSPG